MIASVQEGSQLIISLVDQVSLCSLFCSMIVYFDFLPSSDLQQFSAILDEFNIDFGITIG